MTLLAKQALAYLRMAAADSVRRTDGVPHGVTASCASFYDREIQVAYVHWRTARALEARGLIRYGDWDPETGYELWLTEAGA